MTDPEAGSAEALLEMLIRKLHGQWGVIAEAQPPNSQDLLEVRRDGDVVRAVLGGRSVKAVISYDDE